MRRGKLAAILGGGDRRSIGRSNEVKKLLLKEPERFEELVDCLWDDDPIVRMRAADAAEKIAAVRPELLKSHKPELLGLLVETEQVELRWHLALMVPRMALDARERARAVEALKRYLEDRSSIVKTFALQGLADLAREDANLQGVVRETLENSLRTGTAAMKARARKLLKEMRS
jgi:HEAT repeat protein